MLDMNKMFAELTQFHSELKAIGYRVPVESRDMHHILERCVAAEAERDRLREQVRSSPQRGFVVIRQPTDGPEIRVVERSAADREAKRMLARGEVPIVLEVTQVYMAEMTRCKSADQLLSQPGQSK